MTQSEKNMNELNLIYDSIIDAVMYVYGDDKLSVECENKSLFSLLDYTEQEYSQILDNSFLKAVYMPDREQLFKTFLSTEDHDKLSVRLLNKEGDIVWCSLDIVNTKVKKDECEVYYCIINNISDVKSTELEYEKQSRIMDLIESSIDGGTSIRFDDKKFSIVYAGKDLINFLGYSVEEFEMETGGSFLNIIDEQDRDEVREIIDSWFKTGDYYEVEYRIKRRDGYVTWVLDKGSRMKNEDGDNIIVSLIMDINNTRSIIGKLEEANNDLKRMQDSIPGSFGKVALEEEGVRFLSANSRLYELLLYYDKDVARTKVLTFDSFGISQSLVNEIAIRREDSIEFEHRSKKGNKWFIIRATYADELYEDKYPIYYIMITDITVQKESQFQAEVQKEKFEKVIEITDDIIFEYDCVADVMLYSEKYKEIFNRPCMVFNFRNVSIGYYDYEVGYIDFSDIFSAIFAGEEVYRCERNVAVNDNDGIWMEITAKGIQNEEGQVVKIIGMLRDIDKQKREQKELYDRSRIDLLSGLYNKMSTEEEIVAKLSVMQPRTYVGLVMIDIDDFKTINDMYGHSVGDEVIQKIADILKEKFSNSNVIGRVGGDEFQVFVDEVLDPAIIEEKTNLLCDVIPKAFDGTNLGGKVTVSIGVYYTNSSVSYDVLYKKADVALYTAKSMGKNRYEIYGKDTVQSAIEANQPFNCECRTDNIIDAATMTKLISLLNATISDDNNLQKAFELIGNVIDIDRIIVNLIDRKACTYSMYSEWYRAGLAPLMGRLQNKPIEDYTIFENSLKGEPTYFSDGDYKISTQVRLFFEKSGFKGILQFPIQVGEETLGYIEFVTLDEEKIFSIRELSAIENVARMVVVSILSILNNNTVNHILCKLSDKMLPNIDSVYVVKTSDMSYTKYLNDNNVLSVVEKGEDYFTKRWEAEKASIAKEYEDIVSEKISKETIKQLIDNKGVVEDTIVAEYKTECMGREKWIRKMIVFVETKYDSTDYLFVTNIDNTEEIEYINSVREKHLLDIKRQIITEYFYEEVVEINRMDYQGKRLYVKDDSKILFMPEDGEFYKVILDMANELVHPDDRQNVIEQFKVDRIAKHFQKKDTPITLFFRRKSVTGKYVWVCANVIDVSEQTGENIFLLTIRLDSEYMRQVRINSKLISENEELHSNEESLKNLAKFDRLTGIYNYDEFYKAASLLIKEEEHDKLALVRMDIDKFKLINDLYGYDTGDDILKFSADIIKELMRGKGVYGRLNSDIFCLCMKYQDKSDITNLIERIILKLNLYDEKCRITPFFGICLIEDKNIDVSVLCDWANLALKKVKGSRIVSYSYYDNNMRRTLLEERKFEGEMENALLSGQFEAYLQPQYDIRTSKIRSAEALVRWNHSVEGTISPGRFIPLFERNGFILKLDEFIWEQVCINLRRWIDDGYSPVPISVNVSRLHMYDDGLADKLVSLLNKYKLPRNLLVLEVTETMYYDDSESMNRTLKKLRNIGFQIAMDDFGSGYSSLNMLEEMYLDELKIDRAFLTRAGATENGKVIVQFIISLAKKLNLRVVAEGVENVEQAAMLLEFGCEIAQGYYYSRPVPIDKFESQAFDVSLQKEVPKEIVEVINRMTR